jgi:hypothetical protein
MEAEQIAMIGGVGRVIHAVGICPMEQIGIGTRDDLRQDDGGIVLQRLFDLPSMTLRSSSIEDAATYQRAQTQLGRKELKWMEQGGNTNLFLLPDGIPLTGTADPNKKGGFIWYAATTFGFTEKLTIVTGDSSGSVRVAPRRKDGNYDMLPWRFLVGHSARVHDHAACGRWLVTAGADQTIRLWYLDDVEQEVKTDLEPALNLFVGSDDEWVIWSKSGYYNASTRGDLRFGYHINRGAKKEALFFPSDRFMKTFFRPDIIRAIVEHGSEERALAGLTQQGLSAAPIDVSEILPPIVELSRNGVAAKKNKVNFNFTVDGLCPDRPVTRVWIVRNEQWAWESKKIRKRYQVTLPLLPGRNHFKILAENKSSISTPLHQIIPGPAAAGVSTIPRNGILYLLAVGVSKLQNETADYKSLNYADDDAISIYNAFARSNLSSTLKDKGARKNRAFKSVEARILTNEQATKKAILAALDELGQKIRANYKTTQRDALVVFLSGHGIRRPDSKTKELELCFWNYDLEFENTRGTGLSFMELGQKITELPVEVILMTDACHSGLAGPNVVKGVDPNELAKRIHAINESGMYVLNASRGEELSRELKEIRHGIFTAAILEALKFETDMSMLNLMASVQRRMSRLQTPVFRLYGDLLPLVIYKK